MARETDFRATFQAMMKEFEQAELAFKESQENNPAATRHLTAENLSKVNDFLILDNSLRETTVGTPRGHTLEEKHQIVEAIADTGLKEIILGSFGSKIAVDSQIAEYWGKLGKSFDNTWGFAEVFDMESFDEEPLWTETERFVRDLPRCGSTKFWTPPANPLTTYSKDDKSLFLKASEGFAKSNTAFPAEKQLGRTVLKKSEASQGRIPLGLLMLAGYGIKVRPYVASSKANTDNETP